MSLEETIKKYLPELPEAIKLIKAKFGDAPASKTFKSDNGELIHEGELAVGMEVFLMEADKKVPAPEKTYKHEDGTEVTVKAGKVIDIKKPNAPEVPADMKAFVDEIMKAIPVVDLKPLQDNQTEIKKAFDFLKAENVELKASAAKFADFKTEVIAILTKLSGEPQEKKKEKKTDSSKNIFSADLTMEERVKLLNEQK